MLTVGSTALKQWYPDCREPKDFDTISPTKLSREEAGDNHTLPEAILSLFQHEDGIVLPLDLYTLKISHSLLPCPSWHKHARDIIWMQSKGHREVREDLFRPLVAFWEEYRGNPKKRIRLDKTNQDFFNSNVSRIYPHDSIHQAVKYYDTPMYDKCKVDKTKALLNYELFLGLSFEDKLRLAREEFYVIAIERFLIPYNERYNLTSAYRSAIQMVVTRLSKGWFPEFILQNLDRLISPEIDYYTKFTNNIGDY